MTNAVCVYTVNLDSDAERLARQEAALRDAPIEHVRVPAVRGSSLPRAVLQFIPGAADTRPGTLGCFLSHLRTWEMIRDAGRGGALVLEDDAIVQPALHDGVRALPGLGLDLVFVNDRMSPLPRQPQPAPGGGLPTAVTGLDDVIESRASLQQIACGGDGYFLSARGAEALIATVGAHGVSGDVDWFLLLAATGTSGIARIRQNRSFHRKLSHINEFYGIAAPILKAAALAVPMVLHMRGTSSRRLENREAQPG
ncbi:MAG: glycosyltransferase family 25 protein [Rhodobacteraceae bacterium]|jgi:GR25 family glycosyltransferase involved in LPS biosynthesis|nr:glycosyltransferase family 25 protein [Paracoccaceae bacterium]